MRIVPNFRSAANLAKLADGFETLFAAFIDWPISRVGLVKRLGDANQQDRTASPATALNLR